MRVTDRMMFDLASLSAGQARSRLEEATRQTATGLRVEHPEDDAAAAGGIALQRAQAERQGALSRAMDSANDELVSADVALEGVGNVLSRARELSIQLANPIYSAADRSAASKEVDGLFQQAVALLNTKSGHRYLFGGFQDAAPPFTAAGAYVGDTGVRQVEVAPGALMNASVRADVAAKGVGGGVDVLATLQSLSTALSTNSVAGVQTALGSLDGGISQIAQARSEVGGHQAVLDAASAAARAGKVDAETRLSHLADADAIASATSLAQAERALDAALTASAKGFRLSLLDKL